MHPKINTLSTYHKSHWYPLLAGAFLTIGTLAAVPPASAAEPCHPEIKNSKSVTTKGATTTSAEEAEVHLAKAKEYNQQASQLRTELKQLWKSYRVERNKIAVIPKMVGENPHVKKLRLKTEKAASNLENQITEAEEMARHHRNHARELASASTATGQK